MSMENTPNTSPIKVISPTIHSLLDYVLVIVLLLVPSLLSGVTGWFAVAVYALAIVHLSMTIITHFDGGLFGILSFRQHGLIEVLLAIALIVSPWIFVFSQLALPRNFFIILGVFIFAVWLFTDYGLTNNEAKTSTDATESTVEEINSER